MKIEVGESLFYSWLRHIEKCQVVQLNWKVSATWELHNQEKIQSLHLAVKEHFLQHSEYKPFSNDVRLTQRIKQTELDAIGVSIHNGAQYVYAGEIAFHESGLNYGGKEGTVNKILEKVTRAAMCLIGYIGIEDGDIIFASPKINPMILKNFK